MELYELYGRINLQTEMVQRLKQVGERIDWRQIEPYLKQLTDMRTAARAYKCLKDLLQEDTDHVKMLYCQLECARRIYDKYQEKQIAETVYTDTMKCFPRFLKECKKKNGRLFFDRGWWTYRQVSMNIFRIGELEYQFAEQDGEHVIGIHIPSDADLSEEAVAASLRHAELFFQTYYGSYEFKKYTCHSWLMSPVLKSMLPEGSHIRSFQDRFDIIREDKKDKEYIEWLFQVPADTDHQNLPAGTSLQKKVKELLLDGGSVGCAYGILKKCLPL